MYNQKIFKIVLVIGLFLSFEFIAIAQTITEEEVTVIAPYSPTISKAQKINNFPTSEENTNTKFKLEYYTNPKLISTIFELEDLKAARYISPKEPKYKQNVVIAGMGLYTTPYAELFLNGKLNRNFTLGLHIKHLSSKASVDDYGYSGFSKSGAEVWTKKIGAKNVLWIAGFYQRDAFHYYGFIPNDYLANFVTPPDFDAISKQVFSDAGLKFNLLSTVNRKKESYKIDGSYRYFWDRFNNRENLINLRGSYQRPIEFLGLKNQNVGVGLETEVAITDWEEASQFETPNPVNTISNIPQQFFHGKVDLQLFYNIQFDRFDFKAGGVVGAGLDSTSTIMVYPDFSLDVNVFKNILDVYVQLDGGLISPSYYSLSRENPFMSAFQSLEYTSRTYRLKGGLRANILNKADIHLWGSTESLQNDIFFVTDTSGLYNNQFKLIYDDVDLFQIGGDVKFSIADVLVGLEMMYQQYTMTNEIHAWYKPTWSGRIVADYWLYDNLKLKMALKGQSSVWANDGLNVLHELDSWFDLSLGANYYFNKELNAFISLNNILSQNYELWYNYPVKGFGAMVGVSYAF
ncbi:MAG: hypothetical protein DRI74_04210 [Bacteroidetes bacterium]|nr:MAG: hypothetical protein DRI74_04210 [Bacteroidota bacterium]